jgi:O-antigen/teichoic acid export membrane protein
MLAGSRLQQRRTYIREALLLGSFLLIVIAGVVTVLVPELSKTPDDDRPSSLRTSPSK